MQKRTNIYASIRIEPFSPKELARYVGSAFFHFEKQFFNAIRTELSEETVALFYELLQEEELELDVNDVDENTELEEAQLKLRHLKKDLGGAQLKM